MKGIFKKNVFGEIEKVPEEHIESWCKDCQFPYGKEKCKTKELIQKCWDESSDERGPVANKWHQQHECPFIHKEEKCFCNDFKTI